MLAVDSNKTEKVPVFRTEFCKLTVTQSLNQARIEVLQFLKVGLRCSVGCPQGRKNYVLSMALKAFFWAANDVSCGGELHSGKQESKKMYSSGISNHENLKEIIYFSPLSNREKPNHDDRNLYSL